MKIHLKKSWPGVFVIIVKNDCYWLVSVSWFIFLNEAACMMARVCLLVAHSFNLFFIVGGDLVFTSLCILECRLIHHSFRSRPCCFEILKNSWLFVSNFARVEFEQPSFITELYSADKIFTMTNWKLILSVEMTVKLKWKSQKY